MRLGPVEVSCSLIPPVGGAWRRPGGLQHEQPEVDAEGVEDEANKGVDAEAKEVVVAPVRACACCNACAC